MWSRWMVLNASLPLVCAADDAGVGPTGPVKSDGGDVIW